MTAFGYAVLISNIPEEVFAFGFGDLGGILGTVSQISGTAGTLLQGIGQVSGQPELAGIGTGLQVLGGVAGLANGSSGQGGGAAPAPVPAAPSGGGVPGLPGGADLNTLAQYIAQLLASQNPPGYSPDAAPLLANSSPAPSNEPYSYQTTDTPMDMSPNDYDHIQNDPYGFAAANADRADYHLNRYPGPTTYHPLPMRPRTVGAFSLNSRPNLPPAGRPPIFPHRMAPVSFRGGTPQLASRGGRSAPGFRRR